MHHLNIIDGSGIDFVPTMSSWYPDPEKTTVADCQNHDRSWNPSTFQRVVTSYTFTSLSTVEQVCGFTNGLLNTPDFDTSGRLKGTVPSFTDRNSYDASKTGRDGGNFPKRIYCISVSIKSQSTSVMQCSVGLSLDGMPADLEPEFTPSGIVFAYTDTSSGETEVST